MEGSEVVHEASTQLEIENVQELGSTGIDFALVRLTDTMLDKASIDANEGVRDFLVRARIHDFSQQQVGEAGKVFQTVAVASVQRWLDSTASFYRSKTKDGAFRRFWVSGLRGYASPGDLIGILSGVRGLVVTNLSRPMPQTELLIGPRRRVWWVNQRRTNYAAETEGGYLWAPAARADGVRLRHWSSVLQLRPGDLVLHYHDGAIRAVGVVADTAREAERPAALAGNEGTPNGFLVPVAVRPLMSPVTLDEIPATWRTPTEGPFGQSGQVKLIYLEPVTDRFAALLGARYPELFADYPAYQQPARDGTFRPEREDPYDVAERVVQAEKRRPRHARLVNDIASRLKAAGLRPWNDVVDIGLDEHLALVEAKIVGLDGPYMAVRAAVGQLLEYRYRNLSRRGKDYETLVILLDEEAPAELVQYAEDWLQMRLIWLTDGILGGGQHGRAWLTKVGLMGSGQRDETIDTEG